MMSVQRTYAIPFLAFLSVLCTYDIAEACRSCGRYGTACRYYAKPAYVAPAYTPLNVLVQQVNNPAPIGQGNTLYRATGFQSSAYPFFDRNAAMHSINENIKGIGLMMSSSMTRADALAQGWAAADGPIAQVLANSQAAEQTLNALGVNITGTNQSQQSNAVMLQRDAQGRFQVFRLDDYQAATIQQGYGQQQPQTFGQQQAQRFPTLTAFCVRCHSPDIQAVRGRYRSDGEAVYIGDHATVAASMKSHFFEIVDAVSTGRMPPAGEQQPDAQQKAALFNEIQSIVKGHANAGYAPPVQPQYQRAPTNEPPPVPLPPQPLPQQGT